MQRDPFIQKYWPGIYPIVEPHNLVLTWVPAEDESVDSSIEVRVNGSDVDIADLQLCLDNSWVANAWTDATCTAQAHSPHFRKTPEEAASDLIDLLRRYGYI